MTTRRVSLVIAVLVVLSAGYGFVAPANGDPPAIPGNPGVPGLLAEIEVLNAHITTLQQQIATLQSMALVPRTAQTTIYTTGDDGDIRAGVPFPAPRFTDNADGTVKDNLTGLIWLKNARCSFGLEFPEPRTWQNAINVVNGLADGQCGLSDGSAVGDWRLPNVKELQSLIDFGNIGPALPAGHPFLNVLTISVYWSSTTVMFTATNAWQMSLTAGHTITCLKEGRACLAFVWAVRGGIVEP